MENSTTTTTTSKSLFISNFSPLLVFSNVEQHFSLNLNDRRKKEEISRLNNKLNSNNFFLFFLFFETLHSIHGVSRTPTIIYRGFYWHQQKFKRKCRERKLESERNKKERKKYREPSTFAITFYKCENCYLLLEPLYCTTYERKVNEIYKRCELIVQTL